MIDAIRIALTGLEAASQKVAATASNIANLTTTGSLDEDSGQQAPYTPLTTQQVTGEPGGLGVTTHVIPKSDPFVPAFDPDSPFADENGIIGVPNISLPEEFVNLSLAKLQYKASLKIIETQTELDKELFRSVDQKA